MKNYFYPILILISLNSSIYSQDWGAKELLDNIMDLQSMKELSKFRFNLIDELKNIDLSNITSEENAELTAIYNKMQKEFNVLVGNIKQDILDFKNIRKMAKKSEEIAERYVSSLNSIGVIFNEDFMPKLTQYSQDRSGLLGLAYPLIEKGVKMIIEIIRDKKLKKEVILNELLNIANERFTDKLLLPDWNKLVKNTASNKSNSTPTENKTELKSNPNSNTKIKSKVNIEYPAMKELQGNIEFLVSDESGNNSIMNFNLPEEAEKSRDLTVGSKLNNSISISKTAFGSKNSYAEGSSFQMRITNSGFVYVFAFNSNNTCYPIYPYTSEWVEGFNMSKSRDLSVGPLMMKDNNSNLLVIPSKNAVTGEENYIQMSGNSKKEQLCLIISKSELTLKDICKAIEDEQGTLAERLSNVLESPNTAEQSDFDLTQEAGKINFKVLNENKWVLPFVFEIKRK
jgi:hypothetical protein